MSFLPGEIVLIMSRSEAKAGPIALETATSLLMGFVWYGLTVIIITVENKLNEG
jgi:hypothetical protein